MWTARRVILFFINFFNFLADLIIDRVDPKIVKNHLNPHKFFFEMIVKKITNAEDKKSYVLIKFEKNFQKLFQIQLEMDEFLFIDNQNISYKINEELKSEIINLNYTGNDKDLSNFAEILNLTKNTVNGVQNYSSELVGIFNDHLFKYSLIATLIDNFDQKNINICINISDEFKTKIFGEMNMKYEFIQYLKERIINPFLI